MLLIAKLSIYCSCLHNKKQSFNNFIILPKEKGNIQKQVYYCFPKILSTYYLTYTLMICFLCFVNQENDESSVHVFFAIHNISLPYWAQAANSTLIELPLSWMQKLKYNRIVPLHQNIHFKMLILSRVATCDVWWDVKKQILESTRRGTTTPTQFNNCGTSKLLEAIHKI